VSVINDIVQPLHSAYGNDARGMQQDESGISVTAIRFQCLAEDAHAHHPGNWRAMDTAKRLQTVRSAQIPSIRKLDVNSPFFESDRIGV